eukprot:365100-Chlamydomonas_euryale.AAC.8
MLADAHKTCAAQKIPRFTQNPCHCTANPPALPTNPALPTKSSRAAHQTFTTLCQASEAELSLRVASAADDALKAEMDAGALRQQLLQTQGLLRAAERNADKAGRSLDAARTSEAEASGRWGAREWSVGCA